MLPNRQHIAVFLKILLILLAFTSCASDKLIDTLADKRQELSEGKAYSVYVKLNTGELGMRAAVHDSDESGIIENGEFIHGTVDEFKIGKTGNYIFFFDENRKLYATSQLTQTNQEQEDDDMDACYGAKFYPVTGRLMKYCLVVLNGKKIYNQLLEALTNNNYSKEYEDDIACILSQIWEDSQNPENIGRDDDGLFTMTNAIYIDDNKLKAEVEITDDNIIPIDNIKNIPETPEDPTKIVHIYVERMVSKFSLHIKGSEINEDNLYFTPSEAAPLIFFDGFDEDGGLNYTAKNWRVKVTGWGINALEYKNYTFKKITKNAEYFGTGVTWNDPDNYRSYWTEDLHYDKNEDGTICMYPWQYRKAIDKSLSYYESRETNKQNLLRNFSYKNFFDETTKHEKGFNKFVYTPENTYDPREYNDYDKETYLDNRINLLAGTHLIVCAELQVQNGNEYESMDLYRDRNGVYYSSKKDFFKSFVHTINYTLNSQTLMNFVLYDWENGGGIKNDNLTARIVNNDKKEEGAETVEEEKIEYKLYSKINNNYTELTDEYIESLQDDDWVLAPAEIEGGDGKVMPWPKNLELAIRGANGTEAIKIYTRDKIEPDGTGFGYITNPGEPYMIGTTQQYLSSDYNYIRSLLYEWFGAVDHFNNGQMYYAAPTLHQGAEDPDYATQAKLGDYGVVRNNWYQFNIKSINNIGTPVDNPDQPIVPDRVGNKDIINVKMYFLPWHEVDTVAPLF